MSKKNIDSNWESELAVLIRFKIINVAYDLLFTFQWKNNSTFGFGETQLIYL